MFDFVKLHRHKIHKFRPKVRIYSDRGPFILKTVTDSEELLEALRLRYQVFHREMMGKTKPEGIDVDEFDFICDHLAIIEKKSQKLIGTYRLNSSLHSNHYYSAQEFDLRRLLEEPGIKLELGRACIDKDYRRGVIISMLWRGLGEYMAVINAHTFFGCGSIKTESPRQAALLYQYFKNTQRFRPELNCPPTLRFAMPNIELWIEKLARPLTAEEIGEAGSLIPPLFRAYLKAGALLGGEPAYDQELKCIDFLTIVPRELLNRALLRKYSPSCQVNDQDPSGVTFKQPQNPGVNWPL